MIRRTNPCSKEYNSLHFETICLACESSEK